MTVTAALVVPNGTHRPGQLAAAIRRVHPDWEVCAVWCGDPHLRPVAGEVPWADLGLAGQLSDEAWERLLVRCPPHRAEWIRAVATARQLITDGPVVLLWVGAVGVLGELSSLLPTGSADAVVVPRVLDLLPDDRSEPRAAELTDIGSCSTSVLGLAATSGDLLSWLQAGLSSSGDAEVGRWLDVAQTSGRVERCLDDRVGASRWRWPDRDATLVELETFDPDRPWALDPDRLDPARIDLVGNERRIAAVAAATAQVTGRREPIRAPGAITIDGAVRRAVAAAKGASTLAVVIDRSVPHLAGAQVLGALHAERVDLRSAFRDPRGADREWFARWCAGAFRTQDVPFLLAPVVDGVEHLDVPVDRSANGLNVVGYLTRESSLGDVGRRLLAALDAAGVERSAIAFHRTGSPEIHDPPPTDRSIPFATTLAIVNADQFHGLASDHPELFRATERMIGYWFWELDTVPEPMRAAIDLVDEIWAGSRFVADAFAGATDKPVHLAPIPVPRPVTSGRARSSFEPLADLDDRFVFTVVFDHFSVTERKNPMGAIEAFRRAFAPDEGPVLVVKSMNATERWPYHQQVLAAVGDRPDIRVWDVHLERDDHMAFIAATDALVSLHRSEGLGLHLAEAMWLGTPVIATRYSGNLDLMDDECSILVDAELVPVTRGQGVYPSTARWAEPDIDQAAAGMRRLVDDPALHAQLVAAGRRRMEAQPSLADTGRMIAELLGLPARSR